jgi:hypothetical protein
VHQFRLSQGYRHHSLQEAQRKVADMQAKAKLAEEAKEAKVTLLCALSDVKGVQPLQKFAMHRFPQHSRR